MDNIMNILSILLCSFLWIMLTNALTMSVPVWRFNKHPQALKQYLITADNHIDFQHAKECAAFSTAYVLRHFNIDADGNALYPHFPFKFPDGSISPLGIRLALKRYGFKTKYYKGNIQSLKSELEHGIPVIASLYSTPASKVRHFVPVTGYDEERSSFVAWVYKSLHASLQASSRTSREALGSVSGRLVDVVIPLSLRLRAEGRTRVSRHPTASL